MTTLRDIHFLGTGSTSADTAARMSARAVTPEALAARCMR
jgi:hypothetical protein